LIPVVTPRTAFVFFNKDDEEDGGGGGDDDDDETDFLFTANTRS
jgi:hypothetical protein